MRSLLFVPADSERKLEKGLSSEADALILDLEDSVAPAAKPAARATLAQFLGALKEKPRPKLLVRMNAFDAGMMAEDLAAAARPFVSGIVLPKAAGGADVQRLDRLLGSLEHENGLPPGQLGILPIATETAAALFTVGSYARSSPRLLGLTWGSEDLSADLGAATYLDESGRFTGVYQLARSLCLAGAVAAEVAPIDSVKVDFRDEAGLRKASAEAARDGFTGKMAIHPAQVPVINEAFTPAKAAIDKAKAIVDTFARDPGLGVVAIDGEMFDRPHIRRAERLLARARDAGLI